MKVFKKWIDPNGTQLWAVHTDILTRFRSLFSSVDAGLGIFAKDRFESDVVFGPYWGQKISVSDLTPNVDQSYMWDVRTKTASLFSTSIIFVAFYNYEVDITSFQMH